MVSVAGESTMATEKFGAKVMLDCVSWDTDTDGPDTADTAGTDTAGPSAMMAAGDSGGERSRDEVSDCGRLPPA